MKRSVSRVVTAVAAVLGAGLLLGPPAHADPAVGNETMVEMPMPGPAGAMAGSRSPDSYRPPTATTSEQAGDGGGVDPDGTEGEIDPDGTEGSITGPLMSAAPQVRAEPARKSPRDKS